MNFRLCLILTASVVAGTLDADVPRKAPLIKYQRLWKDSPFTAKPPTADGPVYNPLENYVLLGVSPIADGYRVTLLNKKKPTDPRIVVETHKPAEGFKVLGVIRKAGDPLGTVVRLGSGGREGTVGFEDKFLQIKTAPAAAPPAARQPTPTSTNPASPSNPRTKRPRIVMPKPPGVPTPTTNKSGS